MSYISCVAQHIVLKSTVAYEIYIINSTFYNMYIFSSIPVHLAMSVLPYISD